MFTWVNKWARWFLRVAKRKTTISIRTHSLFPWKLHDVRTSRPEPCGDSSTRADSSCHRLRRRPRFSCSSFVRERASSELELRIPLALGPAGLLSGIHLKQAFRFSLYGAPFLGNNVNLRFFPLFCCCCFLGFSVLCIGKRNGLYFRLNFVFSNLETHHI